MATEIEALRTLSPKESDQNWRLWFECERPNRIYGSLLTQALAYRLQEKVAGGLKSSTRRLLQQVAGNGTVRNPAVEPPLARLKAGTVLVREWHRTTHRVTVEEQGFLFRGERYRSLSEIARTITGTRWSGPLFFGLKSKEQSDVTAIRLVGGAPQQTSGTEGSNALPSATHPRVSEILRCHGRKGRVHGDCDCAQLSLSRRKNDRMDVDPSRRRHLRAGTIKISPQGGLAS